MRNGLKLECGKELLRGSGKPATRECVWVSGADRAFNTTQAAGGL